MCDHGDTLLWPLVQPLEEGDGSLLGVEGRFSLVGCVEFILVEFHFTKVEIRKLLDDLTDWAPRVTNV